VSRPGEPFSDDRANSSALRRLRALVNREESPYEAQFKGHLRIGRRCAALAAFAAPASAATPAAATPSATVTTDAGTSCTVSASKNVGSGLLGVSPIDFKGDVGCSLADQAKAPIYSGSVRLTTNLLGVGDELPLDLGYNFGVSAQPNSPSNVDVPPEALQPGEGLPFVCRVDPGYDCGSTGRAQGLPATPYQVVHINTFNAPPGEAWTVVPEGCAKVANGEGDVESSVVSCTTMTEPFTTG